MTSRAEPAAPALRVRALASGNATSPGNRRDLNEDALLAGPTWFVVADGMGGHRAGEVASALAIEAVAADPSADGLTVDDVHRAVERANAAVRRGAMSAAHTGMGTTLVGAVGIVGPAGPGVAVFHVGDSRCYRLADGALTLLTRDHSYVQELVDAGRIPPDQVSSHPLRNVITRALGVDDRVEADLVVIEPRGRLLLCSDGLSGELDARSIGRVLTGVGDPQAAAELLVELTLHGAARDNVTAVVVDLDDAPRRGAAR